VSSQGIDAAGGIYSDRARTANEQRGSNEAWSRARQMAQAQRAETTASAQPRASDRGSGGWLDRGLGLLQAGFGIVETVGGVAGGILTSETGVGAVAGGVIALHGLDDIQAGIRQAWSGKPVETLTQQAATGVAKQTGMSPQAAAIVGITADIVASGGLGGEKAAATGAKEALTLGRDLAEADRAANAGRLLESERAGNAARQELRSAQAGNEEIEASRVAREAHAGSEPTDIKAEPPPTPVSPPTTADLEKYRAKLGVPETQTVAVGKTDVVGLEVKTFEGASPKVRQEAKLPDLDQSWPHREIKSPSLDVRGTRHAEEGVINEFDQAVKDARLKPEEVKGNLYIRQSNPNGVCPTCIQGIKNPNVEAGIFLQLSRKYPNLAIHVSSETVEGLHTVGRQTFTLRDGKFVE
jgi:hypothetical protein